jgi:hypothetical protein
VAAELLVWYSRNLYRLAVFLPLCFCVSDPWNRGQSKAREPSITFPSDAY